MHSVHQTSRSGEMGVRSCFALTAGWGCALLAELSSITRQQEQ
jgi:hypothetical protein